MVQIFCLLFSLFFCSCSLSSKTATNHVVKNAYTLTGNGGVTLSIEVEYLLSAKGYLNNDCRAQFIVTNTGAVPFESGSDMRIIVFEFTTNDGKVLEVAKTFDMNLQPGKTSSAETVSADAGLNRYCTSVKPVRLGK